MTWMKLSSHPACALLLMSTLFLSTSRSQWLEGNLKDTSNHADYLVIAPSAFVPALQSLATYRASHNSLSVATILTDSIYAQFPALAPDSSIRAFLNYAHSSWGKPAPSYLLIAGNTTMVPTHMEASILSDIGEDSVAIDQWYVDTLFSGYGQVPVPTVAIGRFPAWNVDELSTMVTKTIQYEATSPFAHADRFIMVADSGYGGIFENQVSGVQATVAPVWKDTVIIAVRPSSPQYKPRSEFFSLWNEGTAAVDFFGAANNVQFSRSKYFTSADIDSLQAGSSLTVCVFQSNQRFQKADTVAMAVDLMRASDRGGAAVLAPTGWTYASENYDFASDWRPRITAEPGLPLGMAVKLAKQTQQSSIERRQTLLGDPALVIRHKITASVVPPPFAGPGDFQLLQNYPNPFNPTTSIKYSVGGAGGQGPGTSKIRLVVYDLLGREVALLVNEQKARGTYEVNFDGSGLASGTYIYRLTAGSFVQSRKMMLVK